MSPIKTIRHLLSSYPVSLFLISAVIFLSFFKPPRVQMVEHIAGVDKMIHALMYVALSLALWLEYMRAHRRGLKIFWVWILAFVFPIVFGGVVEILQGLCTTYRGAEWIDFLADVLGTTLATLVVRCTGLYRKVRNSGS